MSAETIPSEVATDLDCIRWYVECLDAVAFKRRAVAGLAEAEGSYNAAMKRLADRSTRPAEPAAPVAEAGDGEVRAIETRDVWKEQDVWENLIHTATQHFGHGAVVEFLRREFENVQAVPMARLSTLEAERARADELRRLLTASGRCVDDLTARFADAERDRDVNREAATEYYERMEAAETELAASGRCIDDLTARLAAAEQRAADALARAEKAEDWQPIETAPKGKNGIAFMMLSFGPPGDQTVSEGLHFDGCFYAASVFHKVNPSDGRQFAFREHEVRPTHWRPTLVPPRAAREAQPATDGGDNG